MATSPEHGPNPYQSPTVEEPIVDVPLELEPNLARLLGIFHSQTSLLGGFWIFAGIISLLVAQGIAEPSNTSVTGQTTDVWTVVFCGTCGIAWLISGAGITGQHLWAVYLGMAASCASAAAAILHGYICLPVIFLVAAIVQSHRVLGLEKQLSAAAVPLAATRKRLKYPLPD